MTKVVVEQEKTVPARNRIRLLPEPVHSTDEVITFLLELEWFPNSGRPEKRFRKGSFVSEKEIGALSKQKVPLDGDDLLHLAFILSEKVYIPERHIDECIGVIAVRNEVNARHLNCLTIVVQSNPKDAFPSTRIPSEGDTQYQVYQYENTMGP